jgi:hypothetical protein
MAITLIDIVKDGGTTLGRASITINRPTAINNDFLIGIFGVAGSDDYTLPSGWNVARRNRATDGLYARGLHVFYKRITSIGSEPSSYTFTLPATRYQQGMLISLRGIYGTDPIDAFSTYTNPYSLTAIINSFNTTRNNSYILHAVAATSFKTAPTTGNWTPPVAAIPSITELFDEGVEQSTLFPGSSLLFLYTGAGGYSAGAAGAQPLTGWIHNLGGAFGGTAGVLSIAIAFNSSADYIGGGGSCTCNAICDNDCSSNQLCTGNVSVCTNSYTLTSINAGDIVLASHLTELQTAINNERTDSGRRFTASDPTYCTTHTPGDVACSSNDFAASSWTAGVGSGQPIDVDHFNDLKNSINEMVNDSGYGSLVTATFQAQSVCAADSVILAADITELQTRINQSRNVCICDSHCNCDPTDCGCNGECPSDDYYYA